jgi:nucleoside-diphosphate-sugar epimerase
MNENETQLYGDVWTPEMAALAASLPGPVLVIGASGFIGAKLLFSLARRRKDVYGASQDPGASWRLTRLPSFLEQRQLVQMDLTRIDSVREALRKLRPRTVFNLAAYGAYERQKDALRINQVNYMGTLNLVLALRDLGCDALVHAGTSSEYGLNCTQPGEDSELIPNSDYAASKVAASYLLKYYGKIDGFPCAHLRLYSVYGPWEERDRLIPRVAQAGLDGKYPAMAEPETSRDFLYIDDATAAFVQHRARTVDQYRDRPPHHARRRGRRREEGVRHPRRGDLRRSSQPQVGPFELVR